MGFVKPAQSDLCAAEVFDRTLGRPRQCGFAPKHDPDENCKPTTCGRHKGQRQFGEK